MFYRRKVVLALLESLGGSLSPTDLQKHLFLLSEQQAEKSYDFIPYRFGCYSFGLAADKEPLIRQGHLGDSAEWKLGGRQRYSQLLSPDDLVILREHCAKHGKLRGDALIKKVYNDYPYYTIRSEVAEKVLGAERWRSIRSRYEWPTEADLLTIGYEGRSIESYMNELVRRGVTVLCDVRKNPVSRKFGFSKKQLDRIATSMGVSYVHMPSLGIESNKRRGLESVEDYQMLFDDYRKTTLRDHPEGIEEIGRMLRVDKERIALTCFEADHACCHRDSLALAVKTSVEWDRPVIHI